MTSVCYYSFIFLVASVPSCLGHADLRTLTNRIEALEKRDMEQLARIDHLEQKAKVSNDKIWHLSTSNENLLKQLAETSTKLARQENITASLRKDLEHQRSEVNNIKHKVETLEPTVQTMGAKIENINKIIGNCKHNFQETIEQVNSEGNTGAGSLKLPYDDTSSNDLESQHSEKDELPSPTEDKFETKKILKYKSLKSMSSSNSNQRATTNTVAFHAVLSPLVIYHLGTNDNIRFDTILLNEGGGYHNQHGLFIAPKPGFYLFSVTIATNYDTKFYAELTKNGVRLANIAGDGEQAGYLDQGSVTVVTKLNAGDEVWIVHVAPTDGSIWGNMYSSFTGILISEFE